MEMIWSSLTRRGRLRRFGSLVVLLACAAMLVAACGSGSKAAVASLGSKSPATSTTIAPASGGASPPAAAYSQLLKYSACMRSHGLAQFPDPSLQSGGGIRLEIGPGNGIDPSSPQFKAAQSACQRLLPARVGGPTISSQDQADYLKAAGCMRAHGVVGFPDPTFLGGGVQFPLPTGMDPNSTQFLKARHTCQSFIPAGLPYSN